MQKNLDTCKYRNTTRSIKIALRLLKIAKITKIAKTTKIAKIRHEH